MARDKKSLVNITKSSDQDRNHIKGEKTLEELARLSACIQLPHGFAMRTLTLPASLAAMGTFLCRHRKSDSRSKLASSTANQFLARTPEVFRESGNQQTVQRLLQYYDHQYPTFRTLPKFQEAIGSPVLPIHIMDLTVIDVADAFKKVLRNLSGRVLGSFSLFEAFQNIEYNPQLSLEGSATDKARLIAYAILSVKSPERRSIICAFLGIASYIGHESKAASAEDHIENSRKLMGFEALGTLLGPLLIPEDQVFQIKLNSTAASPGERVDNLTKSSKLNLSITADVLTKQHKIMASVMQMLMIAWQTVVKELCNVENQSITVTRDLRTGLDVGKTQIQSHNLYAPKVSFADEFDQSLRQLEQPSQVQGGCERVNTHQEALKEGVKGQELLAGSTRVGSCGSHISAFSLSSSRRSVHLPGQSLLDLSLKEIRTVRTRQPSYEAGQTPSNENEASETLAKKAKLREDLSITPHEGIASTNQPNLSMCNPGKGVHEGSGTGKTLGILRWQFDEQNLSTRSNVEGEEHTGLRQDPSKSRRASVKELTSQFNNQALQSTEGNVLSKHRAHLKTPVSRSSSTQCLNGDVPMSGMHDGLVSAVQSLRPRPDSLPPNLSNPSVPLDPSQTVLSLSKPVLPEISTPVRGIITSEVERDIERCEKVWRDEGFTTLYDMLYTRFREAEKQCFAFSLSARMYKQQADSVAQSDGSPERSISPAAHHAEIVTSAF